MPVSNFECQHETYIIIMKNLTHNKTLKNLIKVPKQNARH